MTLANENKKAGKDFSWIFSIEAGRRIDLGLSIGGSVTSWSLVPGHLFVTDQVDHRIKDLNDSDFSFIQQIGSLGAGDDQFNVPWGVCTDREFLYICDKTNDRIKKIRADDLSFVAKIGSNGSGTDQFKSPSEICTDGTYLYIVDVSNNRIHKRRCSDLSSVGFYTGIVNGDDHDINAPNLICYDGTYIWIGCIGGGDNDRFIKITTGLVHVAHFHYAVGAGNNEFSSPSSMDSDGTYLYIYDQNNNRIKKHLCDGFAYHSKWGTWTGACGLSGASLGNGGGLAYMPTGYLALGETQCVRVRKHVASDLSLVFVRGHLGAPHDGDDYQAPQGVENLDSENYYIDLPLPDGMPERITYIDRTTHATGELSMESSEAAVGWTRGTWYYDPAIGRLFVHLPDGSAPADAHYYLMAFFWKKFCDGQHPYPREVVFDGVWIRPRLKRESIPDISQEISGFDEGGVRQTWGSIALENADGELDEEIVDFIWENKVFTIKVGTAGEAEADYTVVSRGRTGSISWDEKEITVGIGDPMKGED